MCIFVSFGEDPYVGRFPITSGMTKTHKTTEIFKIDGNSYNEMTYNYYG